MNFNILHDAKCQNQTKKEPSSTQTHETKMFEYNF